jgi:hemolysin III
VTLRELALEMEEEKPRLRGVLHVWAFFLFLAAGAWLVLSQGEGRTWPALVFASSVVGVFGTSALYHRVSWSPAWYPRIRVLDHAMIFGLILGTYTPLFVISLDGRGRETTFFATCALAGAGVLVTLFWRSAPKWVRSAVYLAVGWMGALVAPDLVETIGWSGIAMLLGGGIAYSIGAVFYALKRPNPFPGIFGYHELFHALVIVAAGLHFSLITFWVLA